MDILVISITAAAASLLTFFSGFGLGTILLPVFVLFFPVDLAIAMTALVHFLNNIFKTGLIGKRAVRDVVLKFGIPAMLSAFAGATFLGYLSSFPINLSYKLFDIPLQTTLVNVVIGLLLLFFAVFELIPTRNRSSLGTLGLVTGGLLSGFFGGLSGHQGALRSAFLLRLGLSKESFIASGIVISLFVDISRLSVYTTTMPIGDLTDHIGLLTAAILSAFAGAIVGRRLLKKITLRSLQYFVAAGIVLVAILLGIGAL